MILMMMSSGVITGYEARSINKLQNGAIPLILKYEKSEIYVLQGI